MQPCEACEVEEKERKPACSLGAVLTVRREDVQVVEHNAVFEETS